MISRFRLWSIISFLLFGLIALNINVEYHGHDGESHNIQQANELYNCVPSFDFGVNEVIASELNALSDGNLCCNDITDCDTSRCCGTSGTVNGCNLDCDDSDPFPLSCPRD